MTLTYRLYSVSAAQDICHYFVADSGGACACASACACRLQVGWRRSGALGSSLMDHTRSLRPIERCYKVLARARAETSDEDATPSAGASLTCVRHVAAKDNRGTSPRAEYHCRRLHSPFVDRDGATWTSV